VTLYFFVANADFASNLPIVGGNMRKIIMFNLVTLDGYFEGPKKWDINWHRVDEEFNEFSVDQLSHAGGLIFGRVTYEGMAAYWPTPAAINDDPVVAGKMNSILKVVFSNTLDKTEWNNTRLIRGDAVEEMTKIKAQAGNDLLLFGSAKLASTFTQHDLIDEYRLMVNPVVLGEGEPLFKESGGTLKLKLINTRVFHNGTVLLSYIKDGK
jgi:dihydrofolate reductase